MYWWILCTCTETNPWIENLPTEIQFLLVSLWTKNNWKEIRHTFSPKHLIFSKLFSFNDNLLKFVHFNISAIKNYRSNLTTINSTVKSLGVSNTKNPLNLETQIRRPAPIIHVNLQHTQLTLLVIDRLGSCHVQIDMLINRRHQAQQYRKKIRCLELNNKKPITELLIS